MARVDILQIERRLGRASSRGLWRPPFLVGLLIAVVTLGYPLVAQASGPTVDIGKSFFPSPVTISVGQSVTWVNKDNIAHFLAWELNQFPWSGRIDPGTTYRLVFKKAGTYNYYDQAYTQMTGTIIVNAAPASTATPNLTPKATARPTTRPTARPTARPSTKPTVKATARPTAKPTAAPAAKSLSPTASDIALAETSTAPKAPSGPDAGGSPASGGSADFPSGLIGIIAILGLMAAAFMAGIWMTTTRRNRPAPPLFAGNAPPPVAPVPPPDARPAVPGPVPARSPVAGQPRRVERPVPEEPSYPYDIDEDAPIENSRTKPRSGDHPSSEGL